MNDKVNLSAEPIAEPISIHAINPLIHSNVADTINYVSAVLEVMEDFRPDDGGPSKNYNLGMHLIHRWLGDSLRFANKHPGVEEVIPVVEESQS